jgi:hypothetical protein
LAAGPAVAFVAAEPSPWVAALAAGPAAAFVAAEPSPWIAALDAEPAVDLLSEPQAFVDIAVPFVVLVPASVVLGEVDSSGPPKFLAFPNVDHFASSSSSVEDVG